MNEHKFFDGLYEGRESPLKFDWRKYVEKPEDMPPHCAEKLDELAGLLNGGSDEDAYQFLGPLQQGRFRSEVILAFINFYRGILTEKERGELLNAAEKCKPTWRSTKF